MSSVVFTGLSFFSSLAEPDSHTKSERLAPRDCFSGVNEFRCYEAKIEESEKAGSRRESNPGHPWLEPPVLCH